MTRIFVSYRRDDDPYAARGITKALSERFGRENVFFDLESIRAGLDFRKQIDDLIAQSEIMLVVIGDGWLRPDESGQSRLEAEKDIVALEITAALARDIPVVPVLVGRAGVPAEEELPASLTSLAYRQGVEVRATANFDAQIGHLIKQIEAVTAPVSNTGGRRWWIVAGVSLLVVASLTVWSISSASIQSEGEDAASDASLDVTLPSNAPVAAPLAFDPSAETWSGSDVFEIDQDLELENEVVDFDPSEHAGFGAKLIAEYPNRRVYRMPEQGVLVETEWALGIGDEMDEPILRRLSDGQRIAVLGIEGASMSRSLGLIAGVAVGDATLLQLFRGRDGTLERTIHVPELAGEEPLRVDIAPDGRHLFVATYGKRWMSVDVEEGLVQWSIEIPSSARTLFDFDVAFDWTGRSALLFTGTDRPQEVHLIDGVLLGSLTSPPYELNSMAPHPAGTFALFGTNSGLICLGRLDGDRENFCFGDGWGTAVSPTSHYLGRYVAAVFYDRGVVVYDLQERTPVAMIVPQWKVYRTEFEPRSDMLLIHSSDKSTLWELTLPH